MSNNRLNNKVDFASLLPLKQLESKIQEWIDDDIPTFDIGGMVVGTDTKVATLWLKSSGVFAGKPFVDIIFTKLLNCTVEWNTDIAIEGTYIDASNTNKIKLATVTGPANKLLQGERTALNTLSRCSGVATESYKAVTAAYNSNPDWHGWIAGTRKTTPGCFRIVEKYGLLVGGAATHRLDLSQMIMLKDNHIWANNNNIPDAVSRARLGGGFSIKIEVECQSLNDAIVAASAGADIIMLDNYTTPQLLHTDATLLKQQYPNILIEASGGITIPTLTNYIHNSVDIISLGSLTQGYPCLDYSLKVSFE